MPENTDTVGIDVGLKTFATLSNGEEIANPRFFRKEEKTLAKVQRKHSKLAKGTPERRTHRKAVARVRERIAFRRANFTHQESGRSWTPVYQSQSGLHLARLQQVPSPAKDVVV